MRGILSTDFLLRPRWVACCKLSADGSTQSAVQLRARERCCLQASELTIVPATASWPRTPFSPETPKPSPPRSSPEPERERPRQHKIQASACFGDQPRGRKHVEGGGWRRSLSCEVRRAMRRRGDRRRTAHKKFLKIPWAQKFRGESHM